MGLYENWRKFEDFAWVLIDGGIKGLLNLGILLLIYYFVHKWYPHLDTVTTIVIFFTLSLIIGTIIAKSIKIHIGYTLRANYYAWLDKIINKGKKNGK